MKNSLFTVTLTSIKSSQIQVYDFFLLKSLSITKKNPYICSQITIRILINDKSSRVIKQPLESCSTKKSLTYCQCTFHGDSFFKKNDFIPLIHAYIASAFVSTWWLHVLLASQNNPWIVKGYILDVSKWHEESEAHWNSYRFILDRKMQRMVDLPLHKHCLFKKHPYLALKLINRFNTLISHRFVFMFTVLPWRDGEQ